ncbi:MAG: methylenetetrahydrofolate reductase [Anaerolineae bacterium]
MNARVLPPLRSGSRLERILRSGQMAVTGEIKASDGADPKDVIKYSRPLANTVDAINAVDGASANSAISSIATCALLVQKGLEPTLQMNCRDRNRIAMQSELLGAAALGIKNVFLMSGDDVVSGDQPESKRVYDLGSVQLIRAAKIMRDQGVFLSGRKLSKPPRFFIGAADNPFIPPYEYRHYRLAQKVEAGADFVQTQWCFDPEVFRRYMQRVRDLGLHERVFILVGVGPIRSERAVEFMRDRVPGMRVPDEIVERMRKAPKERKKAEGVNICVEIMEQVREIEGVAGFHVMAYGMEDSIAEILERTGLSPRPTGEEDSRTVEQPAVASNE